MNRIQIYKFYTYREFHPPNGCHQFNHFVFYYFSFEYFVSFVHLIHNARRFHTQKTHCFCFSVRFFLLALQLSFHQHHRLHLLLRFLLVYPICVCFLLWFVHAFELVTSYFCIERNFSLFSSDSISYYYEFSKEQDYICSKPEDSGMHQCTDLPPFRIGPMICNGK